MSRKTKKNRTHCSRCGLPFRAINSFAPVLIGGAAGGLTACTTRRCSPLEYFGRVAGATLVGTFVTAMLELAATKVCKCPVHLDPPGPDDFS
jgi:hypothetical protein